MQKAENRGQSTALTSGSIKKQLVLFSIPIFLGTLLQQLYNVIDAVVAGRLVNEDALSAIGVSVVCFRYFGFSYWYHDTSCPIFWSKAIRAD